MNLRLKSHRPDRFEDEQRKITERQQRVVLLYNSMRIRYI